VSEALAAGAMLLYVAVLVVLVLRRTARADTVALWLVTILLGLLCWLMWIYRAMFFHWTM